MNRKEFLSFRGICPDDAIDERRLVRAGNPLFDKEIRKCKKLLEEDHETDESYKMLLSCLVNMDENFEPQKELQDKDDVKERSDGDSVEENDPQSEHFLKHLKEHDKFYALEYEKDGVRAVYKYGEDSNSAEECDPEPRRKWRRTTKLKVVPSNEWCLMWNQVTNKTDKVENVTGSPNMVLGRKQKRAMKQKIVPSNERRLTRSQVTNQIDRMKNVKGSPDMVLDLHKDCDLEVGKKVIRSQKQKVGPSNKMQDVENRPSSTLKMTMRLTQSRKKLANEVEAEMGKGSQDVVLVSRRRKLKRVVKRKVGTLNQTTDVENKSEHDQQSNSVKKTNGLTKRMKALPNNMVPELQYHHLNQNVKLEDDQHGYMHKENTAMPDVKKKHKHDQSSCSLKKTKRLTKRKVPFEVDKVYNDKDRLNVMALDSHKECDREPGRKITQAKKQRVRPSNPAPNVGKTQKYDLPSCSLKKSKGLAKRKVKLEVDKIYNRNSAPDDMVLDLNKECNLQPRRKLDRATKQNICPSNKMPGVENRRTGDQQHNSLKKKKSLARRILTDEVKVEKMKDCSPIDLGSYPEYVYLDDDHGGYMHKGNTVVIDEKNCGLNNVKKECADDIDSDVQILDSEAIIEECVLTAFVPSKRVHYSRQEHFGRSREGTAFRKQVLSALGKPFDKEEYMKHQEAVKCYLDHHPDLRRKLAKYRYKQGKRLNIYRGFFFWLQNLIQEGSFKPWRDRKCLAVEPVTA